MAVITLTTDFGTQDWFVGTMRGVIAGLAPEARVIDLCHDVTPGDIRAGAFTMAAAVDYFPEGSVHVAVIDPGVGSERQAITIQTDHATLVGPDNGVLSWAVRNHVVREVRALTNPAWWRIPVSRTFHGRDIFAPAAAHLAAGAPFAEAGEMITDFVRLPWPEPVSTSRSCAGEVLHVDRFGNAITNIPSPGVPAANGGPDTATVRLPGNRTVPLGDCYANVDVGHAVAVIGSSGFVEIAINRGDAARTLGLVPGTPVVLVW